MMTNAGSSPDQVAPRGNEPSDKSGETLHGKPANITLDTDPPPHNTFSAATQAPTTCIEEPDMVLEPDLPSDGRDEKGEAMIRDLPQRPELSESPSQQNSSSNTP